MSFDDTTAIAAPDPAGPEGLPTGPGDPAGPDDAAGGASVALAPPPPGLAETVDALLADDPPVIDPDSLLMKTDEDILSIAQSRMARAVAFRAPFEVRWRNAWLDWMLYLRGDAKAWQSRVKIPLVYEQVSSAMPNFVAAVFDSGKLFEVEGRDPASDKNARAVQEMVEHFLRVVSPSERQVADWIKYAVLFGTGVLRPSWLRRDGIDRQQETVEVPMPDGDTMTAGTRTKNVHGAILDNRPQLVAVDLWNFFAAPFMDDDYNLPWCFERVESTIEQLRADAKSGFFGTDGEARVESWLDSKPEQQSLQGAWTEANSRAESWNSTDISSPFAGEFQTDESNDRKHAQVIYWLMVANDYRIAIAGDGTKVLGRRPNPYNHGLTNYVQHWFDRIPKCPYGRGAGEVLEALQRQIDFNYNKGNDAAQLALNRPLKLRGAGNASVQTVWQPGVVVRLRDTSDLEPLEVKNPMAEVSAMNAELSKHADKATGLNDLARGDAPIGANTATEFAGVQAQFRMRMSGHARELKVSMGRVGLMVVSMLQQFIDGPTAVRVVGELGLDFEQGTNFKTIESSELVGRFDVRSTVSFSKSNPALIRQDLLAAAQQLVGPLGTVTNLREFAREFWKGFGFEHPERLMLPEAIPMRDPMLEQAALDMGIDVDPSPLEVETGGISDHLMRVHFPALKAHMANPSANPAGLAATKRHIEKTMMMAQAAQQQMGAMAGGGGAGGPSGPGKKPAGGSPERREATRLGQGQGSDGRPGMAPGPGGAPGRPTKEAA